MASRTVRRRLGDLLIEAGLLTEQQLKAALSEQRKWGGRLGRTVIELGFVTETAMGEVLAKQLNLPSIDLDTANLPSDAPKWLRLDLCERYGVFPVTTNVAARLLTVATSDPTNLEHQRALEFATGQKVNLVVATASAIERAIRRYYFGEEAIAPSAPRPPVAPSAPAQPPPPPRSSAPVPPSAPKSTNYELDELMGEGPEAAEIAIDVSVTAPRPMPATGAASATEMELRREVAILREKLMGLEEINASQVRALRVLLELLIESGLLTRAEYLEKLNTPE